ncbi:MAG: helix-turn-helix transcriptional regulator [Ignavibacteriae bacterium]|nr:helix-turn-helix transcriptional regulator [Ignavibacteriota bacterium]
MKKFKDLIKTPEYWQENIQNELFRQLTDYMEKTGKSQSRIAKDLKVSKSYVSQILNGNFNFTLNKLIELSLYMGKVPDFNFISPESYISKVNSISRKNEYFASVG